VGGTEGTTTVPASTGTVVSLLPKGMKGL
jgi:hypothetical protein